MLIECYTMVKYSLHSIDSNSIVVNVGFGLVHAVLFFLVLPYYLETQSSRSHHSLITILRYSCSLAPHRQAEVEKHSEMKTHTVNVNSECEKLVFCCHLGCCCCLMRW